MRCFEHAYRLDDDTAALLARPGTFLTPTLCVTRSESWMRANGFAEHTIANAASAADEHLASIQRAIRAGVTLLNGTDYPPGDLVDGIPGAVHELLLMAAAGLTPLLALQSVSVNAAALLGIGDHVGPDPARLRRRPARRGRRPARRSSPRCATISLVVQGGRVVRDSRAAADAADRHPAVHRLTRVAGAGGLQPRRPPRERHHGQRDHRHRPGRGCAVPRRHRARPGCACSRSLAALTALGGAAGRRGAHGVSTSRPARAGKRPRRPTARCSAGRARQHDALRRQP